MPDVAVAVAFVELDAGGRDREAEMAAAEVATEAALFERGLFRLVLCSLKQSPLT